MSEIQRNQQTQHPSAKKSNGTTLVLISLLWLVSRAWPMDAQTAVPPVRLAIVAETPEVAATADILTAALSANPKVQLLERDQVAKVYHEQGLSAANDNYLKLGQLLGADGLLLMETTRADTNEFINVRLVAVKPGVVLVAERIPLPVNDLTAWRATFSAHIEPLLPKLVVTLKDAIPLSIVNLRSANSSGAAKELELELKLLTVQRLSREPRFFVLERQEMRRLTEENDLGTNETPFWNGSYLIDGVVDQAGYSPNAVTLNVRLTPPGGGPPLQLEVSGSRSNLVETVNQLATKVAAAIKVESTAPVWDAASEAKQYFDEANWAMSWGVYSEAQAAAESAWALGKHDPECATLRIRAYMVSPDAGKTVVYYPPSEPPAAGVIASSRRALELYNVLSLNLPPDEPKVGSDWYKLGLANLATALRILQVYNWSPDFYEPVAGELAELRAAARATDAWLVHSPSVHDSYFVGDRAVAYDELDYFMEQPTIFSLELDGGGLWQETPEDCLALYRTLLASPVFRYLHDCFWYRDSYRRSSQPLDMTPPRIVAWTRADQKRIPAVWQGFLQELDASPNPFCPLEAKALRLADARENAEIGTAFTNFFDAFFAAHDALVTNNVDVLYLGWQTADLVERTGGGIVYASKDALQQVYDRQCRPKIEAMGEDFKQNLSFLQRRQYLKSGTNYNFMTFAPLFGDMSHCTKSQAVELKGLMEACKSKIGAADRDFFDMTEASLDPIINAAPSPAVPPPSEPAPAAPVPAPQPPAPVAAAAEVVTNAMLVKDFLPVPLGDLPGDSISGTGIAHHWVEGKLVLDFQCAATFYVTNATGRRDIENIIAYPAIAILNPVTGTWRVAQCPGQKLETASNYHDRTTLWHDDLYTSNDGQIKKFDFQSRQWQNLAVSTGANYELFNVNDRLYAADANLIFEITGGGTTSHILASRRRRPAVSTLDSEDFGVPVLFPGADHSLRICVSDKIFTWTGNDWQEDGPIPSGLAATTLETGLFLRNHSIFNEPCRLLYLGATEKIPQLYLESNPTARSAGKPRWEPPKKINLANVAATIRQADLLLLVDHSSEQGIFDNQGSIMGKKYLARNGYEARLLRYTAGQPEPQSIYLNFDDSNGCLPLTGKDPASMPIPIPAPIPWIFATGDSLFMGREMIPNSIGPIPDSFGAPGVWVVSYAMLEPVLAGQSRVQLAGLAQAAHAADENRNDLLAKYDLNHNGVIDPDEREDALSDPAFIKFSLAEIDANHNGLLDVPELAWFDANQNKKLDPDEEVGLATAQRLLAEDLFKKFDANADGRLDRGEFHKLFQTCLSAPYLPPADAQFQDADSNRDGNVDLLELEAFLQERLTQDLHSNGNPGAFFLPHPGMGMNRGGDREEKLIEAVEHYWRHGIGGPIRRPMGAGAMPNGAAVTPPQ